LDALTTRREGRSGELGGNGCVAATPPAILDLDPGFLLVRVASDGASDSEICAAAWGWFTSFWEPVAQYATGELFYPVETRPGAAGANHYSHSNEAGAFHTDGALLPRPPDVAALVCLSPADRGGETILVDGTHLARNLLDDDQRACLRRAHPFASEEDASAEHPVERPVLTFQQDRPRWCYLRRYIEAAYCGSAKGMPGDLRRSLDVIDRHAGSDANQQAFRLARGELLVWDNRRFFHGRRSFVEAVSKRRLRRIYGRQQGSQA
jgi:alpha-ketoglutarate-dependent taurine dioxygenase